MGELSKEDKRLFAVLVIILLVSVVLFIVSLAIVRTPSEFTQIWLESSPETVEAGQEFEFSFVIDNREASDLTYTYTITAEGQTKKQSTVFVASGVAETLTESLALETPSPGKTKVLVEVQKPEWDDAFTLWFWVEVLPEQPAPQP